MSDYTNDEVNFGGGKALDELLQSLSVKLEKNIMRSALRAGAKVYADEIKKVVPVAPPNTVNAAKYGYKAGSLRDSIRIKTALKSGKLRASVRLGGKLAYYATMVEYGTKPHRIAATDFHNPLSIAGRYFGAVNHPGAREKKFMRPVFDSKHEQAIAAVGDKIRERLTKEGIDVPDADTDEKA